MDPNLFHADMNRVTEVLLVVILLALMLERALSLVFEHRWFVQKFDQTGIKEIMQRQDWEGGWPFFGG